MSFICEGEGACGRSFPTKEALNGHRAGSKREGKLLCGEREAKKAAIGRTESRRVSTVIYYPAIMLHVGDQVEQRNDGYVWVKRANRTGWERTGSTWTEHEEQG